MNSKITSLFQARSTLIWSIGVFFVLFQFFLQLSSGVVIGSIMHEMQLSAFEAGILSSAFYYIYTSLQIPVGILFDQKNTRLLLAINALICSLGCLVFSFSANLFFLIIGRLLMGAGSAFAFVGLSHLLRQHFPLPKFGFLIGLSETLGFLVTTLAIMGMGATIAHWGWRSCISSAAFIGLIIAVLCWRYIPQRKIGKKFVFQPIAKQLFTILKNPTAWFNGLFAGLTFSVITVWGAMWAIPFIQMKMGASLEKASFAGSMLFLGAAISCPLFGILANHCKRKPLLIGSSLLTALLVTILIYLPISGMGMIGGLQFLTGICCGAYMLAFSIANELTTSDSLSTCTGFTNTLAMLTAPLMQPLIGYFLDRLAQNQQYNLSHYQNALSIVPLSLLVACIFAFFLPEKNNNLRNSSI